MQPFYTSIFCAGAYWIFKIFIDRCNQRGLFFYHRPGSRKISKQIRHSLLCWKKRQIWAGKITLPSVSSAFFRLRPTTCTPALASSSDKIVKHFGSPLPILVSGLKFHNGLPYSLQTSHVPTKC